MCYKGANELRQAILAGLFICPGYWTYLQQFAKKQLAEVLEAISEKSAELDVPKKSESVICSDLEQIKYFQKVYSLNGSDWPKVTKTDEKPAQRRTELETDGDSPDEMN